MAEKKLWKAYNHPNFDPNDGNGVTVEVRFPQ